MPKPCGVFAANDEMARAVISACEAADVSVPDEIAVIGCSRRLAEMRFRKTINNFFAI